MSDKELNSVIDRAEDEYQKLKDKVMEQSLEIERLKELCNKYEEEHNTTFEEWKNTIAIIDELEKWVNNIMFTQETYCINCMQVLNKVKELKGVDKE